MIVFFHGLGCDATSMESMAAYVMGDSDKWIVTLPKVATSGSISKSILLETAINDISSRLETVQEVHLVAHSLGAAIALPVALHIGAHLKSITVFEGNLIFEDCGLLSTKLSKLKTKEEVSKFVESFASSSDLALRAWAKMATEYDANTLIGYAKELVSVSKSGQFLDMFLGLSCNKLYVYGEDYVDHPTTLKISNTDPWHLKGTGHFAVLEQPEACAQLIDQTMDPLPA